MKLIDICEFPEGTNLKTTLPHLTNKVENLHIFNTTAAFCDVFNLFWRWWKQHIVHNDKFYKLTLKLKPLVLQLYCVPTVNSSFQCLCTAPFQVFGFWNTHSKILGKLLPVIVQTSKQSMKFSFLFDCSKNIVNPVFSFYSLFSSYARIWITHAIIISSSQLSMLMTVKSGSIRL